MCYDAVPAHRMLRMKPVIVSLLIVSVLCMVPLMGADHAVISHLHHGQSSSCASCMGVSFRVEMFFLLIVVGLSPLMIPSLPPLPPIRDRFHPPRLPDLL